MLCIYLKNTNPYFCLAAEEYLLKNFDDDIFLLWQSNNTVVVGKHQNALGEINYRFVRKNNIIVARRISGGGTVFHDPGNVNFSFIKNVKSSAEISFKQFTQPVVEALSKAGCRTYFVALPEEGVQLRKLNRSAKIFVLAGVWQDTLDLFKTHQLAPVLNTLEDVAFWKNTGLSRSMPFALHVDTGMNRLGLTMSQVSEALDLVP
ncbi:MAG: alanine racemase, partial [Draconibacterium sp.]|nr:alanine racemase [Draconibacterium sp.]